MAIAAVLMAEELAGRPALRAWIAAHERERRRLKLATHQEYAVQVLDCDPADWSRVRHGKRPMTRKVALGVLIRHPEWEPLWLRLCQEEEQRAMRRERGAAVAPPPDPLPFRRRLDQPLGPPPDG